MTNPAMKQPALKAALYARYSSDLQKDTSIEDQFGMLEKAAKRLGLQLDKRYYFADRAQTGTTLFDRPGLTRDLLGAASRNEFDAILVEATDRLSRSQADLFWLSDRFQFHNIKLFTQNGEVSDMQLTFDGHANADYIKKLAMRVKRGHDRAAEQGRIVSALAYGYDAVPGKPGARMINESEAAVVRRIFADCS
jgi:site-specific DNA recombinase